MTTLDQTTKTITFPVWRDDGQHWFFISEIIGCVAFRAIRQSPYTVPDNLSDALAGLHDCLKNSMGLFDDSGMAQMTGDYLEELLLRYFAEVPEILAWNRPKSGHDAPFVFTSRYGGPHPDDDMIDLYALARNVKHSLLLERLYEKEGA